MSDIAFYFNPDKQENGAFLPGVPARDLTTAEVEAMPDFARADIAASPLYRKTKPPTAAAAPKRAKADDNASDAADAPAVDKEP